ncbi:MAG: hypothetical protein NBV67_16615, partial [Tagaea sp.]|nr:hypothetical protein [Tagaea sp.]
EAPKFGVKPNRRLDAKAPLMEFERWNRDWARGSGDDPKGLAPEYESYIRDLDKDHGHDPGLIFARDLTQQVEKYHGNGGELAKQFVTLLADRPDLQREYLGGEVPKAPLIGTFKPGGEEGVKKFIDDDRVANGLAPRYAVPAVARGGENVTEQRVSARGLPASKPINLFDLAQEIQESTAAETQPPVQTVAATESRHEPIAPYFTIEDVYRRRQSEAARQRSTTTEAGPAGPESGPTFTEGISMTRRPNSGLVQAPESAPIPPPPAPVPLRPGMRLSDGSVEAAVVPLAPHSPAQSNSDTAVAEGGSVPGRTSIVSTPTEGMPERESATTQANAPESNRKDEAAALDEEEKRQVALLEHYEKLIGDYERQHADAVGIQDRQAENMEAEVKKDAALGVAGKGVESGIRMGARVLRNMRTGAALGAGMGTVGGLKGVLGGAALGAAGGATLGTGIELYKAGVNSMNVGKLEKTLARLREGRVRELAKLQEIRDRLNLHRSSE